MPKGLNHTFTKEFLEKVVPNMDEYEIVKIIDALREHISKEVWDKFFGD